MGGEQSAEQNICS